MDLHDGSSEADEPSLTAVAELALLLDLIQRGRSAARLDAFALDLSSWLIAQANHPSMATLIRQGPALALSAPMMLRAALGETVEIAVPVSALAEACSRLDMDGARMPYWRRLETAVLARRLGLAFDPVQPSPRSALRARLSTLRRISDLYEITHEVFHLTRFGVRALRSPRRLAAVGRCRMGLAWALTNAHIDLIAEFTAALNCLGEPRTSLADAWAALDGLAAWTPTDRAQAIAGYHPHVAILLAAVTAP